MVKDIVVSLTHKFKKLPQKSKSSKNGEKERARYLLKKPARQRKETE